MTDLIIQFADKKEKIIILQCKDQETIKEDFMVDRDIMEVATTNNITPTKATPTWAEARATGTITNKWEVLLSITNTTDTEAMVATVVTVDMEAITMATWEWE